MSRPSDNDKVSDSFFRDVRIEFLIHELKDPVAVVETGVKTLLDRKEKYGGLTARQEKTLNRVLRNAVKTREMLYSLLEIGRSEEGCFAICRFRPSEVAFQVLVNSLETMAWPIYEGCVACKDEAEAVTWLSKRGVCLNIGDSMANTEMTQDEIKFRQILGNLIKNALHYRKAKVEIRAEMADGQILIDVEDDGPGIDPKFHRTIFQRYTQAKEAYASMDRTGHGLGLAGALILAKSLGGDIRVSSEKGKGTVFHLTLPAVRK